MRRELGIYFAVLITVSVLKVEPVALLDGKLRLDTTEAFVPEKKAKPARQSIADFAAPDPVLKDKIDKVMESVRLEGK
jgi:hypothetical protein